MKRKYVLIAIAALCSSASLQAQTAIDLASEVTALKAAVANKDFYFAQGRANLISLNLLTQIVSAGPKPADAISRAEMVKIIVHRPACALDDSACLLSLADQVTTAVEAGKLALAAEYAISLRLALNSEASAYRRIAAQDIDPGWEIEALKFAVGASDFHSAVGHGNDVMKYVTGQLMSTPRPADASSRADPQPRICRVGDVKCVLSLADEVRSAVEAGKLGTAMVDTSALIHALLRESLSRQPTPTQRLAATEQSAQQSTGLPRYLQLPDMATAALDAGDLVKASEYANELLASAGGHPEWRQGEAVFYGNSVLGELALNSGNLSGAGLLLLAAGKTQGSPRLDSFGPGMKLAAGLLAKGQRDTVLEYLNECRTFWTSDRGRLDAWVAAIQAGKTPDFGANLRY